MRGGRLELSDFKWSRDEEISNFPPGCVSVDAVCSAVHGPLSQQQDQSSVSAAGHRGHPKLQLLRGAAFGLAARSEQHFERTNRDKHIHPVLHPTERRVIDLFVRDHSEPLN